MTKVYYLAGMSAGKLKTTYCGVEITLNFRNGQGTRTSESARLCTSEPFIQDAIEHDSRFGHAIRLGGTYASETQMRNETQSHQGFNIDTSSRREAMAREALAQIAEEEKQKKAAIKAKRERAKAATKAGAQEDAQGLTFASANEAMHFLMEKGEDVTNDNMEHLLEQYGATIKK